MGINVTWGQRHKKKVKPAKLYSDKKNRNTQTARRAARRAKQASIANY
jgi:hypothetical protein